MRSVVRRFSTWGPVVGAAALAVGLGVAAVAAWHLPDDGTDGAGMLALAAAVGCLAALSAASARAAERLWRRERTPPPGWYPDPVHEAQARWWTGRSWTARTTDDPRP